MKNYSLLILGRQTYQKNFEIKDIRECWEYQTISLYEEFKKFQHVNVNAAHIHWPKRDGYDYTKLPKVDCVLFNGLPDTYQEIDIKKLKEVTEYKKLFSIMERAIDDVNIEWRFGFKKYNAPAYTFIKAPINKKLYKNLPKEPKTILLDHSYLTTIDWTLSIEEWLAPYKNEYKIYRLIRPEEKKPFMHDFVIPIQETFFFDYLELTNKMENFIITHPESMGFAVIDMCARGIRTLAPVDFLHKEGLVDVFNIETFKNREEFLKKILTPPNTNSLNQLINNTTDYSQIVKIIDKKIRELLLTDDVILLQNKLKDVQNEITECTKP